MRGYRLVAALFGIAVGVAGALAYHALFEAPEVADPTPIEFPVRPGEGFRAVAQRLESEGLVVSAFRFRVLARIRGVDRAIRAGTYEITPGSPPLAILDDFVSGNVRLLKFTVPEGWRIDQIADEAERALGVSFEDFLEAARDSALAAELDCPVGSLEGYLFPETYRFPDGAAADEIVRTMTRRFVQEFEALEGEIPEGLSRHDVVTLASIVETETKISDERSRVAAVYLNRLKKGWKLQADPTVRYALGRFRKKLYYKHLEVESPYNTYRNEGLPPGAIANPGRAALQAVLDPLEPCEDLFFVASGTDGRHVFSKTKAEHDRARRQAKAAARRQQESSAGESTPNTPGPSAPNTPAPAGEKGRVAGS